MTTIAYRDGILAADSCYTESTESGGSRVFQCRKLYTVSGFVEGSRRTFFIGFAGGAGWRRFLDWVRAGADWKNVPEFEKADDFDAIVVMQHGMVQQVYTIDKSMEAEPIVEDYHAIGSGAKCAFIAMDMGASAISAVERAAVRDPYTRGPFHAVECKSS